MRISDWSSDVCSSDLLQAPSLRDGRAFEQSGGATRMSARDDNRQRGMVLIFALVFLLIITIAAIVSFKMSKTSLDIVGNTQSRDAAIDRKSTRLNSSH